MPAPVGRLDRDDDMVVVMGLGLLGAEHECESKIIKNWIEASSARSR